MCLLCFCCSYTRLKTNQVNLTEAVSIETWCHCIKLEFHVKGSLYSEHDDLIEIWCFIKNKILHFRGLSRFRSTHYQSSTCTWPVLEDYFNATLHWLVNNSSMEKRHLIPKGTPDWKLGLMEWSIHIIKFLFELIQIVINMHGTGQERGAKVCVKHSGGSVVVWSWISASRVQNLVKIAGNMNAEKYGQIFIV